MWLKKIFVDVFNFLVYYKIYKLFLEVIVEGIYKKLDFLFRFIKIYLE